MGYCTRLGEIAFYILQAKIAAELPHFDKISRERFFIEEFTSFFNTYTHLEHWVCKQHVSHFGHTLAKQVYGTTAHTKNTPVLLSPRCFLWMCFVYLVCLSRRSSFDIGDKNLSRYLSVDAAHFSEDELIEFWSEVCSHVWQMRRKHLHHAQHIAS